jgi:ATP-dependent DNA helicase RecQ
VIRDVQEQLGGSLTVHRGTLTREGLRLQVFRLPTPAQRLAWLVSGLSRLDGTGIVYCLTVRDSVQVAEWLRRNGIDAVAYNGEQSDEARQAVEAALLANEVKVVVATSALGMGFDKPDLAFVIHFQSPGSPIAYYQQVGRAGRGLPESYGILLAGNEDRDIQDYFIRTAFPSQELSDRVIALLTQEARPMSTSAIEAQVNIAHGKLVQMMKVLEVEGAVEKVGGSYQRTLRPWSYPRERG